MMTLPRYNLWSGLARAMPVCLILALLPLASDAATPGIHGKSIAAIVRQYNVQWKTPGLNSEASMPIGNGDIGLNVWGQKNGDVYFYIGKTDAWGENVFGPNALMKLGLIRISLTPRIANVSKTFSQKLRLYHGCVDIHEGTPAHFTSIRIWVDANNPVIRVLIHSQLPEKTQVRLIDWRTKPQGPISADTIVRHQTHQILWYHRDGPHSDVQVKNLTFGAVIRGTGMINKNASTLVSGMKDTSELISIYPRTAVTSTSGKWLSMVEQQTRQIGAMNYRATWRENKNWWAQFWHRSWIFVSGDAAARNVTQGYVLQRFISAVAGRGTYPIKFNGSIFVVGLHHHNADYRKWGGQYWFQNTRLIYWPMLMEGDFDMMKPLFRMYKRILSENASSVKKYYHQKGSYIAETAPYWGGITDITPKMAGRYTLRYFTPVLELTTMMLDYYRYTDDTEFARNTLVPMATAGLTFFDRHFPHSSNGKLLLSPDNALETYWDVRNPAPDIAGLRAVLQRMLALPKGLVSEKTRHSWKNMLLQVPALPRGAKNGKEVLLAYTGPHTAKIRNCENPALYAVFPFALYGLDRPNLTLATNTFAQRRVKSTGDWRQDAIDAALLGDTSQAKKDVVSNMTSKSRHLKFPAFWASESDYAPSQDTGAVGQIALQDMLLQPVGRKLLLLPAWPADWNVNFKLHAPWQTTIQGRVRNGKLVSLTVTPASRRADVVVCSDLGTCR